MKTKYINSASAFLLVCLLLLGSCSGGSDDQVYDIQNNPDNLPQAAVELIGEIEAGKLNDYESVVARFEKLYESHMDLLDSDEWGKVIGRLGAKFTHLADSLVILGPDNYYQAGGLYILAAYSRPEDDDAAEKKRHFETWRDAIDDSSIVIPDSGMSKIPTLAERISIFKHFMLSDTVHRSFGQEHIAKPLFGAGGSSHGWLRPDAVASLSRLDRAFLSFSGLIETSFDSALAFFADDALALLDLGISRIGEDYYCVEAYFVPRDSITEDYTVAFRIQTLDSSIYTTRLGQNDYLPYDFTPIETSSSWPVGKVAGSVGRFVYKGDPGQLLIGLYLSDGSSDGFFPVADNDLNLIELPASFFPSP
ncbi:MAG: hypothetical protein V3T31_02025 [candidate division Zixibacteria bacterium]